MMGSDARDMMGLPSAGPPKPAAPKIVKPKIRGPSGIAREVMDLNFEGAPPISIVAPKFKEKPKLPFKPRRWEQTPFTNSARSDGLILKHWKREGESGTTVAALPVTPADSNAASEMDTDDKPTSNLHDSTAAKWNVKIPRPTYTDEEYEKQMTSETWTKDETNYLLDVAIDYDLRWIIIADRYDYKPQPISEETPSSESMDIDRPLAVSIPRTMEDLKARYYSVAAKCIALRTPLPSMSTSEFENHEKMTKFDPKREALRKKYAEQLFNRSPEDAHEEELLLRELSRIVLNQEKLYQERKALYDRLEAPPTNTAAAHASTSIYQSSQGLAQLMQSLLQQAKNREAERKEKRRSALGIDTDNANNHNHTDNRAPRSSLGSAAGTTDKRQPHPTPQHRPLTHTERTRFGVTYPQERLTSGVSFRHERVVKASQAKSTVQTTRISDALAELSIPARLFMPTAKVIMEYERLVDGVKNLVEVRKLREKVDGEIKVWEAQRNLADGKNSSRNTSAQPGVQEPKEEVDKDLQTRDVPEAHSNKNKAEANAIAGHLETDTKGNNGKQEPDTKEGEAEGESSEAEADAEEDKDEELDVVADDEEEDQEGDDQNSDDDEEAENAVEDGDEDDDEGIEPAEDETSPQAVTSEIASEEEDEEGGTQVEEQEEEDDDEDEADEASNDEDDTVIRNAAADGESDAEEEENGDDEGEDDEDNDSEPGAEVETKSETTGGHTTRSRPVRKRSASVISAISSKSSKRHRK